MNPHCQACAPRAIALRLEHVAHRVRRSGDLETCLDDLAELVVQLDEGRIAPLPGCPMCQLAVAGDRGVA